MSRRLEHVFRAFLITIVFASSAPVKAAESTKAFHDALATAYGHYRESVFYAERGNAMSAAFELDGLMAAWANISTTFGTPPDAYSKDGQWLTTLRDIDRRIGTAQKSAAEGQAEDTLSALTPIRRILSDLRRRNGVVIFSDCIDTANAAFKKLFHFRRQPPDFSKPEQVKDLGGRLKSVITSYQRCRDTAPPKIAADAQFQRLMKDSLFYLDRIWLAIEEKNQLNVVNILRRVVSSDKILWLRFG
ncbi:MAG: hypothetical protein HOA30_03100 [Rhodospirillaceae bacterium]|nr:hypothetical protein [Rhodospirillaceae bacterium]